jgi:hypothetical protein
MSEQDMQAKFQGLPTTVREKVNVALADAKIAVKLRIAEMMADRDEVAEHAVTTAGHVGAKSGEVSELTAILPLKTDDLIIPDGDIEGAAVPRRILSSDGSISIP